MSATRPELVKKSGTKSVLWDFFGLEQGRDGELIDDGSVICRSCRRRVIARSGNTSNLLAHLKANHPKIYSEAKESMSTKERPRPSTTTFDFKNSRYLVIPQYLYKKYHGTISVNTAHLYINYYNTSLLEMNMCRKAINSSYKKTIQSEFLICIGQIGSTMVSVCTIGNIF